MNKQMMLIIGMVVVLAILGLVIMKKQSSQTEMTPSSTTERVIEKSTEAGASGSMQKVSASSTSDPIDQELNALNKELDGVSSNDFKAGVSDDATLGL